MMKDATVMTASGSTADEELKPLTREVSVARRSEAEQLSLVAVLGARRIPLEVPSSPKDNGTHLRLAGLMERIAVQDAALAARELALAEFATRCEALASSAAQMTACAERRLADLRTLTAINEITHRKLDDVERAKTVAEARVTELKKKLTMSDSKRIAYNKRLLDALAAHEAVLADRNLMGEISRQQEVLISKKDLEIYALRASTSWRLTAPIRRVKLGLSKTRQNFWVRISRFMTSSPR